MTSFLLAFWIAASALAAPPPPPTVVPGQAALVFALSAVNEDVATETVNKVQVSLSDFAGVMPGHPRAAVVVHFCDVDRSATELKVLNRIQRRFGGKGVQVLVVAEGEKSVQQIGDSIAPLKLDFPVLRDVERLVAGRYGISQLPLTLVIEGNGHIFAIGQPRGESMESELEAELQPLLKR